MPTISTFYGIRILLYFNDHNPPHFHARYGEHEAEIAIANGEVLEGSLPRSALRLVREWLEQKRPELMADWDRARAGEPPLPIEGLDA